MATSITIYDLLTGFRNKVLSNFQNDDAYWDEVIRGYFIPKLEQMVSKKRTLKVGDVLIYKFSGHPTCIKEIAQLSSVYGEPKGLFYNVDGIFYSYEKLNNSFYVKDNLK